MLYNAKINKFIAASQALSMSVAQALLLRSLALYSLFAVDIARLDPCAATLPIHQRTCQASGQLPQYATLATMIPKMPLDIRVRLCLGDYILLAGAYVLSVLRGGAPV